MADEIVLSIALKYAKGGRAANTDLMSVTGLEIDVTGTDVVRLSQTIGLTVEALDIGDITTPGYIVIKNKETYSGSNYVTIRNGSGGADVIKLFGGDACAFRAAAATLFADATGATQEIDILIIED